MNQGHHNIGARQEISVLKMGPPVVTW